MPPHILLIGIGNEYRRDDDAGLAAIRALKAKGLPGTLFKECTGDGADLLETWRKAQMVIRIDALTQPMPARYSFHSTHAFGVVEAIELARALHMLPPCLIVYAIEGKNFATGTGLSPEVEKAVQQVVEQVTREVQDALLI